MIWTVGAAVVVVGALALLVAWRRRRRAGELVSIVLLRRERRGLSESDLRGAVRRALRGMPGEPEVTEMRPPDPGITGGFAVLLNGAPILLVIDAGRPYEEDPAAGATVFEDPRAREAYAAHRAWISVDAVGGMPTDDVREVVFAMMGRVAAELFDEECTLLYAPAFQRVALPDAQTEEMLRGPDPMGIFGDDELNTPIHAVEADDRRVQRAMEEARRQWPRFVDIWLRDGAACEGLVKGRFEHAAGNEYMWVQVEALDDGAVSGVLVNEPAHVAGLAKGQTVSVSIDDVADWACVDGEKAQGMFVERVLARL
jgi:uncharacterized protein YegJ (DUF2314 family)